MRVAALVTPPGPEELLVALPNTTADEAPVARGRGRFMRGGLGGNLRYRDLQGGRHGRGPTATRAGRHPIALGGLLTTRALRSARSVRSNSPEGSSRIGGGLYDLPLVRYPDTPFFGVYFHPAGRYRVSVHENVLQEGARRIERVSSTSPSRNGSCANKFSTNLAPPGGGSPLPCV